MNRHQLAKMSLHEITTAYGKAGLLARFTDEAARIVAPIDLVRVNDALALAQHLHRNDQRQSEPYINHPLRVALRIICHYGVSDPDMICAALLHDVIEDHAADLSPDGRSGAIAVLADAFGDQAATLVVAVTNTPRERGSCASLHYQCYVAASLSENPAARVLKVSDFTDNAAGIHYTTGEKAARLARKYAPLVPVLAELVARSDTPLASDVKVLILAQLVRAASRLAAKGGDSRWQSQSRWCSCSASPSGGCTSTTA